MRVTLVLLFFIISPVLAETVHHQHGGRPHTHVLPAEGLQHRHNQQAVGAPLGTAKTEQITAISTPESPHPHGYFSGPAKLEQLPNTRKKRLLETLIFTDPSGKRWVAPKGHVVDGASIPKVFQPIVGSPFGGKYVMASIIHDVGCDEEKETWQAVHRVFYDAMLASGVEPNKARLMYKAVFEGGPRWGKATEKQISADAFKAMIMQEEYKALISDMDEISKIGGEITAYAGTGVYGGVVNDKHVGGIVTIYNQAYASVTLGNGKPRFTIGYAYDSKRDSNEKENRLSYKINAFLNDGNPGLDLGISYKGNIGGSVPGDKNLNAEKMRKARLRLEKARICYEKKHKKKYVYSNPIENEKYVRCN